MRTPSLLTKEVLLLLLAFSLFSYCSSLVKKNNKTHTVEIKQMKFVPAELAVEKGDTILFINQDFLTHDVTEQTSKAWSSSPLPPDSSWRFIVSGTSDYYCTIHPVMKGRLVVK